MTSQASLTCRATCRHFHSLIEPYTHAELLQIERSPLGMEAELYTCGDCIQLLPKSKFADNMLKGKRGKGGSFPEKRFCIRRGIPKYTRGSVIGIMGEPHVVCIECGVIASCSKEGGDCCQACWTRLARRMEEWDGEGTVRASSQREGCTRSSS